MINELEKKYLIELLQEGKSIPEDFKYILFPTMQKEYELSYAGKMRKEDVLANEDGTFPVPIQIEKQFNGDVYKAMDCGWKNMIVYGDNLQFLKTIYENKDPIIKNRVKGKVKLIYIDPPFATQDEFQNKLGAKAYNDKKQGAEFLEFLRRRLILAREILAEDGSIYVHMDYKMGHYVKIILDEIFGKNQFRNEISWCYTGPSQTTRYYPRKHDNILFYAKSNDNVFNTPRIEHKDGIHNTGQLFGGNTEEDLELKKHLEEQGKKLEDWWIDIWSCDRYRNELVNYPTQKPEALLERIIRASTDEGDLVLDFFGGSGTTMVAAEKTNRRWIICDLGKLSYFTMQKRLLQIEDSKSLENNKEKYNKKARSFMTCKLGLYDLKQTLELERERYNYFVSQLFEFELQDYTMNGIQFDGEKRGYPVKIFDFMKFQGSSIDDRYLRELNQHIGRRSIDRIYIVSPATRVHFIADYEEIDGTKYYFLKVPYEMIEELHKKPFQKIRQPKSKKDINNIEEMIGFQFVYPPEVSCEVVERNGNKFLKIKSFKSHYLQDDNGKSFKEFETLSAVFIDYDFDGKNFVMDEAIFSDDIIPSDKDYDVIKKEGILIDLHEKDLGETMIAIFSDIYGNDSIIKIITGGTSNAR